MTEVRFDVDGAMGELVLNRPDKRNAVTDAMVDELAAALGEAEAAGVRALVVRGEGGSFCAGRDLGEVDLDNDDAESVLADRLNPVVVRLADFPAPTFAAVDGPALGFGLGLALACDVVFVAENAVIGSPFGRIGAVLDSGAHAHLVHRIGPHRTLELVYTGRMLSGAEAASWGVVNRSLPADELLPTVRAMAAGVATGPTAAYLTSKRLVRAMAESFHGLGDVLTAEAVGQGAAARSQDYREGIGAFLEKRKPNFVGG